MDQRVQAAGTPGKLSPVASCQGGVFVPVQDSSEMWSPQEALEMGTVFPCLYSPWEKGEEYDG